MVLHCSIQKGIVDRYVWEFTWRTAQSYRLFMHDCFKEYVENIFLNIVTLGNCSFL